MDGSLEIVIPASECPTECFWSAFWRFLVPKAPKITQKTLHSKANHSKNTLKKQENTLEKGTRQDRKHLHKILWRKGFGQEFAQKSHLNPHKILQNPYETNNPKTEVLRNLEFSGMRLFCLQSEASCFTVELFYLQLTIPAFFVLTVVASLLAVGASLLTVGKCV